MRWSLFCLCGMLAAATPAPDPWEPQLVEAFVDGVMDAQRQSSHYAGAVVVIVRDGRLLLSKGYGYSDAALRAPVDPKRTLFRIASNSKMFLWTAVMQLAEQGQLDLHTDVNRYLKNVQVPSTFPEPITLEHLMTHTPGFEDKLVGLFARDASAVRPLAELVRRDMPARVFPPGTVPAYSNYGTAVAGLIVEQVSGMPYETYLREKILGPLGMTHATIAQPPPELAGDVSKGYRWSGGRWKEEPFIFVPWAPAGAMSASGEDMGRFLLAHLNDGALGEARILRPETARAMRARLTSFSQKTNGMLHGFFEMNQHGEKIYGHGGDLLAFKSLSAMFPERRMGFFVAYNTDTGPSNDFAAAFLDHFFPQPLPREAPPPKDQRAALARFAGAYAPARSSASDVTTIGKLMNATRISVDAEGYLNGAGGRWRQVEPLVFAQVDGKRRLVFRENSRGEIVDACQSPICIVALRKLPWWDEPAAQRAAAISLLVVMLGAVIGYPIAAVLQRGTTSPGGAKLARGAAWLTSALFLAGLAAGHSATEDATVFLFGVPPGVKAALTLWAAGAAGAAVLMAFAVEAWRRSWWRVGGRVGFSLAALAAAGSAWWLHHWNLLGWRY